METNLDLWSIILLGILALLLLFSFYGLYSTLKARQKADSQLIDYIIKINEQAQNTSYSLPINSYMKKPGPVQKNFNDSFMDISKDQGSRNTLPSSTHLDKPKGREEGYGHRSDRDRSIDFLLLNSARKGIENSIC